jgi:hypothetical protein
VHLRRNRKRLTFSLLPFFASVVLILCGGGWFWLVVGIAGVLAFGALAVRQLRPFRFRISEQGLDLRTQGINRLVGWGEIDTLALDQRPRTNDGNLPAPRLLLVPVAGSELNDKMVLRSPLDGRPARLLLVTTVVQQDADEIAGSLDRVSGGRFHDLRGRVPFRTATSHFPVVPLGFDRDTVDDLVHGAEAALASRDPGRREQAKRRIDQTTLTAAPLGYRREEVLTELRRLSWILAPPNVD